MTDQMDDRDDKLIAAAAGLATAVAPQRDLWPAIEEAIEAPQRRAWRPSFAQAAAILLMIGASSGLTYVVTNEQQRPVMTQVTPELVFQNAAFSGSYSLGPDYQLAYGDLAAELDTEMRRLSPEARAAVEENLAVIRAAITEINAELENEPNNALLQDLLTKTYREELALMQHVGSLTQRVMARKDM